MTVLITEMRKSAHTVADQTDYQLYSQSVIDYTERKLIRMMEAWKEGAQKLELAALIESYRHGNVAVAWRRGVPMYINITHDDTA